MKTIQLGRCNYCSNCSTVNRWEIAYKAYLKDFPEDRAFVEKMRDMDNKALPCFNFSLEKALKDLEELKGEVDQLGGDTMENYR